MSEGSKNLPVGEWRGLGSQRWDWRHLGQKDQREAGEEDGVHKAPTPVASRRWP